MAAAEFGINDQSVCHSLDLWPSIFFKHLITEINIQSMYLIHLRGHFGRGDGGQVLRAQVLRRVGK